MTHAILKLVRAPLGWAMPERQIKHLLRKGNSEDWTFFRNGFVKRWTTLNIVDGLIMGAISTILFSSLVLSDSAFVFAVISLLGSLISIGFGTGLMYVLGDVSGETLSKICHRFPVLFAFALSIPQVWAAISFSSFFAVMSIYGWEAIGKGVTGKVGIIASAALTVLHLLGFAILFRAQDSVEVLAPSDGSRREEYDVS